MDLRDGGGLERRSARRLFRLPYRLLGPVVLAVDMVMVISIGIAAGVAYQWSFLGIVPGIAKYAAIGVLAFTNLSAILAARGDYRVDNLANFSRQARDLTLAWSGIFLLLMGVAALLKVAEEFSRGATLTFFALGLLGMIVWRGLLTRFLVRALAEGGFASRKVIVIGERSHFAASRAIAEIQRFGYMPVQSFHIGEEDFAGGTTSARLRATISEAIEAARSNSVEEVLLLIRWDSTGLIESITAMLSVLPIPVYLLPDQNVSRYLSYRAVNLGALRAAEIQRAPLKAGEQLMKRCFDLAAATFVLLLLSPLMLLTALWIKLDSRGPILFLQTRNGFNGHAFRIVKFRSMHVYEDGDTIRQATRADPRVTKIGRWLRRTNIDELPQLFNVLYGNMSLVGPRPHAAAHNSEYEKVIANYAFRYHVKPGITGWAQVNGYRGETPFTGLMEKRVELDLWYISNWSMWLDIRISISNIDIGSSADGLLGDLDTDSACGTTFEMPGHHRRAWQGRVFDRRST